jgi:hypothetical protein
MNVGSESGGTFYRLTRHLAAGLLLLAGLSACAVAPTQEMSDARQTLYATRIALGDTQEHPEDLRRAERLLQQAQLRLGQGDYRTARQNAVEARQLAVAVRQRVALELK